uniref:Phosphate-regulating neutral endopeptidase (inferred by orthology to a human protein) n=1 Tax=Strongyloides venezuelensis TaxID=75913 RepID=A0A0K0FNH2_STRVS
MNFLNLFLYTGVLFSLSQGDIHDLVKDIPKEVKKHSSEKLYNETATRSLHEYLDFDVDPCDDFYSFSCGKWIKTQKKIREHSNITHFTNSEVNFENFVTEFEEGKYNDESRIIHTLHKLREKCKELPEDKIFDCNSQIFNFGKYALSSLFIRKNRIKSEKNGDYKRIVGTIERIKEEFRLLIDDKKDIFDEETRKHFLHKLNTMKFERNIDRYELFAVELMEECYEGIGINYNDHITNILKRIEDYKALSDNNMDNLESCRGLISQSGRHLHFYVYSNVFYDATGNFFTISSDTLNEPSFSKDFPNSLNYGYFGYTVANEMLHAFESDNYKSILEGGSKSKFTSSKMSMKNFEEKSDCFVKQYGIQKESITNKNVNGLETLSENIADNGVIKIVHRAYMKWLQSNGGKDLVVPGFENFTNEQLFFISLGRSQCVYTTKNYLGTVIDRSKHIPALIRTNMALSNYKPFSNAFKCELNSKMNPEDKCKL